MERRSHHYMPSSGCPTVAKVLSVSSVDEDAVSSVAISVLRGSNSFSFSEEACSSSSASASRPASLSSSSPMDSFSSIASKSMSST